MSRTLIAPRSILTPYGRATLTPDGWLHVTAYPVELVGWAEREYRGWPCSRLACATDDVFATFDADGNLIDVEHPGVSDVPAYELSAWAADVARSAGFGDHPSVRE